MQSWIPIESAPRDGTEILVSEYGTLDIAFWSDQRNKWLGPYDMCGDVEVMEPTHWMPLPTPP
jgi:hypothetical protein